MESQEKKKMSSVKIRTITGLIMGVVVIGVLFIPSQNGGIYVFQAGMVVAAIIGSIEMINMFETE